MLSAGISLCVFSTGISLCALSDGIPVCATCSDTVLLCFFLLGYLAVYSSVPLQDIC
jgi:hypothetical protein